MGFKNGRARKGSSAMNLTEATIPFLAIMKEHCRWRATRPSDLLFQKIKAEKFEQGHKIDVALFFEPFTTCIRQISIRIFLVIAAVFLICTSVMSVMRFPTIGVSRCTYIRVDLSAASRRIEEGPNVMPFSLLRRGCEVFSDYIGSDREEVNSHLIAFSTPLDIDGFSIEDSSRRGIKISCSEDNKTWTLAAAPNFRLTSQGVRFLSTIWEPHQQARVDLRAPWPLFVENALFGIIFGIGCGCIALCGSMEVAANGKGYFLCFTVTLALNQFAAFVGYLALGYPREAFGPIADTLVFSLLAIAFMCKESMFIDSLTAVGVLSLSCSAVRDFAIFGDRGYWAVAPPVQGGIFLATGLGFVVLREKMLATAFLAIRGDRHNYDAEWSRIVSDPDEGAALARLEALADQMTQDSGPQEARHFNRIRFETTYRCQQGRRLFSFWVRLLGSLVSASRDGGGSPLCCSSVCDAASESEAERSLNCIDSVPGSVDRASPVRCLDQLYSQALGVVEILHGQCSRWAEGARGALVSLERGESGVIDSQSMQLAARKWIQLRFLKSPQRAVRKALTCYGGDASRIVDLCRARILFDRVADIAACLEAMRAGQPNVRIVRVKNFMAAGRDSWMTAGFRAVVVNLKLDSEVTRMLGVENHVCEVQLVLKSVAYMESAGRHADMHQRYLCFRAMRRYASLLCRYRRFAPTSAVWPRRARTASQVAHDIETGTMIELAASASLDGQDRVASAATTVVDFHEADEEAIIASPQSSDASASELNRQIYLVFVRSTLHTGAQLDVQAAQIDKAVQFSSTGSALFTSKPLAAAASKTLFRTIFLVLSTYFFFRASVSTCNVNANGMLNVNDFRIRVLGLREARLSPEAASITNYGLLKDGCPYGPIGTTLRNVLALENSTPINGYYFVTANSSVEADPVKWIAEARAQNDSSWERIGASAWITYFVGLGTENVGPQLFPWIAYPTPMGRGVRVDLDLRPSWPQTFVGLTWGYEWAICFLLAAWAGKMRQENVVHIIFVVAMAIDVLLLSCAVIGFQSQNNGLEAIGTLLYLPSQLLLLIGAIMFESRIVIIFLISGLLSVVLSIIHDVVLYEEGSGYEMNSVVMSQATGTLFFAAIAVFFRKRLLVQARCLILQDKLKYDKIWGSITSEEVEQATLKKLRIQVESMVRLPSGGIPASARHIIPRQFNREQEVEPVHNRSAKYIMGIPGRLDLDRPVRSLDQLYVQASCLHPILLKKTKTWAAMSRGMFLSAETNKYVTLDHETCQNTVGSRNLSLKFAKLKSTTRAIEKVVRSYRQDVSMLVDICRQSIVFERIEDMISCLEVIERDEEAVIIRVKNRLDPQYDSSLSAGYRDVALNLRVVNKDSSELGVETHICELQLLLRQFAELKSDEGHKRYVVFRNIRGE